MITELHAALARLLPDVRVRHGPGELNRQESPPLAVLVPATDTFEPYNARATTPERVAGAEEPLRANRPPYSRLAGFALHLWGKDYPATDALVRMAVQALRKAVGSALELYPSGYEEDGESEGAAIKSQKRRYVLNFRVYQAIGAEEPGTAVQLQRAVLDETEILEQSPPPP